MWTVDVAKSAVIHKKIEAINETFEVVAAIENYSDSTKMVKSILIDAVENAKTAVISSEDAFFD